jgi:ABC-2 type transport system permease protein
MSQNTQPQSSTDPIVPPWLLLAIAGIAFIVAFAVAFTQGAFSVISIAALFVSVASLIGWALFAPDQFRAFISGRTLRFGGLSVIVTIIFIAALVAIYTVVKSQNWRVDLTQQDTFSLTENSRAAVQALGADPTTPPVRILAFYGVAQAANRDQQSILFDDFVANSNGKISYEFVDPDRNPVLAEQLGVTTPGQIAVVPLNEDGSQNTEKAEIVQNFGQEDLINAIIRVSTTGDFRAYFLSVEEGLSLEGTEGNGLSQLNEILTETLQWTTQEVSLLDIAAGDVNLADPVANGTVLVIPGGQSALSDENLAVLTEYVNSGGDLVVFADISLEPDEQALATAENFSNFLRQNYGVSFNTDVVLDVNQAFSSEFELYTTSYTPGTPITTVFDQVRNPAFVFDTPHPIAVEASAPENVTVTTLVNSSDTAYAKSIEELLAGSVEATEDDPKGPFPLAVTAENTATGSRLVLVGSKQFPSNRYLDFRSLNVVNYDFSFYSLVWVTGFDEFFTRIPPVTRESRPQDAPIFASEGQLTTINLVTVLVIPFGILALGFFVWWSRRNRIATES